MSHPAHGHDEHDSHGHDDHGHDTHGGHDSHGHDEHGHDDHGHDDHGGHDDHDDHGHDDHGHDDHGHDEHDEEDEEKEFQKLNDLEGVKIKDLKDVDMYEMYILSPLKPFQHLFKKNTLDIGKQELNKINLTIHPKIKILQLKKPISDIKKVKKNKDININDYCPEIDKNTLNMMDLENTANFSGPYPDLLHPKKGIIKTISSLVKGIPIPNIGVPKVNIQKPNFDIPNISLKNFSKKGVYFLLVLLLLFSYGFFTKIKLESTISTLKNMTFTTDVKKLQSDLLNLKSDVIVCEFLLKPVFLFNYILQNETLDNAHFGLNGISYLVNYAINLVTFYDGVNNLVLQKGPNEVMYSELLKNADPLFLEANENMKKSVENFEKIKHLGDKNLEKLFQTKLEQLKLIQKYTNLFYTNQTLIAQMLGDEKKRTYLVVFQNSDEIRPTGGFMGSVGLVQLYKGRIINFEKKDIYALEWLIKETFNEKPPVGLESITKNFTLRDANYFLDIKQSSEKIKSFIDRTQYNIDGIVYINQNIILDFLKNFGGVYFETVKREVNADNFSMVMSTLVESKVSKTHTLATPKQVLFDFIDLYGKELKNKAKYSAYIHALLGSIEKRDILFHSFIQEENDFFKEIFLVHDIDFSQTLDFNYPVFTSISGNKSDRYMERQFIKNVKRNEDCSFDTELKIVQKHNFSIGEEINIKNFLYDMDLLGKVDLEATLSIQGKALNKQYIRVLLPKNAQIKENEKLKIKENPDSKEVSFYLNTNILFPTEMNIVYHIPNPACGEYSYSFIKQPGIKEYKLNMLQDGNQITDSYFSKDFKLK